jgi:RimJ/RimL family protein N-acetyltransferase
MSGERFGLNAQRTKNGRIVSLRPAMPGDVMLLYKWQTHPSTRQYARNPRPPTLAEHCEWFGSRLGSADCIIMIILLDDAPAGCLRLDRLFEARSPAWEVSINIAPDYLRLGLAKAALGLARSAIPGAELIAHVLPRNTASHALFRAAGFWHGSDGNYHLVCAG